MPGSVKCYNACAYAADMFTPSAVFLLGHPLVPLVKPKDRKGHQRMASSKPIYPIMQYKENGREGPHPCGMWQVFGTPLLLPAWLSSSIHSRQWLIIKTSKMS